jgi:hypothetical protein
MPRLCEAGAFCFWSRQERKTISDFLAVVAGIFLRLFTTVLIFGIDQSVPLIFADGKWCVVCHWSKARHPQY